MLPRPKSTSDAIRRLSSRLHIDAQRLAVHAVTTFQDPPLSSTCTLSSDALALMLPDPVAITPQLVELGIEEQYAERMSLAMTTALSRFKTECVEIYQRRLQELQSQPQYIQNPKFLASIPRVYLTIYNAAIRNHTSYLMNDVAPRIVKAQALRKRALMDRGASQARSPFNYAAIPILEHFFEVNAFPTRLEKCELAEQCEMQYKQIKVWFENRRRRNKAKDSMGVGKKGNPVFDDVEKSIMDMILSVDDDADSEVDGSNCTDVLSPECPSHAYPAPYPPICSYDPFPKTPAERVLQTPWMRSHRPSSTVDHPNVDILELATSMSRLTLDDNTECDQPRDRRRQASNHSGSCHIGFITPCSRAPHPALLRRLKRLPRNAWQRSPAPRRPVQSRDHRDRAMSGAQTRLTFPTPLSRNDPGHPTSYPTKRALPRRIPRNPPSHRAADTVDFSRSSSLSTTSRASSVSSPSSTWSGSSSDSGLPLSTPPSRSVVLPDPYLSPDSGGAWWESVDPVLKQSLPFMPTWQTDELPSSVSPLVS